MLTKSKLMYPKISRPTTAEAGRRAIKREMLRALNRYERLVEMERVPFCSVTREHVRAAKNEIKGLELVMEAYGYLIKKK